MTCQPGPLDDISRSFPDSTKYRDGQVGLGLVDECKDITLSPLLWQELAVESFEGGFWRSIWTKQRRYQPNASRERASLRDNVARGIDQGAAQQSMRLQCSPQSLKVLQLGPPTVPQLSRGRIQKGTTYWEAAEAGLPQDTTRKAVCFNSLLGDVGSDGSSLRSVLLEVVRRVGNNFAIAIAAVLGEPSDNRGRFGTLS